MAFEDVVLATLLKGIIDLLNNKRNRAKLKKSIRKVIKTEAKPDPPSDTPS